MKIQCNVAGITFRNKDDVFTTMRPDGALTIRHDPANKFDQNAIEVLFGGVQVGFIKSGSYAQEFLKDHPDIDQVSCTGYSYAEGSGSNLSFNSEHKGRLSSVSFEIVHGEDDVVLTEDNKYVIGGDEFFRLSNVISHYNPEPENPGLDRWKIDHKDYDDYMNDLNTRARAGTAMHNAIEEFIKTGKTDILIPEGFYNFVKKHDVSFCETEILMKCEEYSIAGRADAVADVMDGPKNKRIPKRVLIDWKSSKKPTKKHAIQCAWYAVMQGCDEAWIVAFGASTKQGYSLMKIDCDRIVKLHALVCKISECMRLMK